MEDFFYCDIRTHMIIVKALEDKLRGLTAEKIYVFESNSSVSLGMTDTIFIIRNTK